MSILEKIRTAQINRNTTWSILSYLLRVASRRCHDEAGSSKLLQTDPSDIVNRTVARLPDEQYRLFLMKPDQPRKPKVLRVAIIGEPNSGKSTLVNRLMGWKINAVSSRVHTTRKNTSGILTEGDTQIVFVDTPGVITAFQRKRHKCDPNMLTDPEESLTQVDAVGVVVDVSNKWTRTELNKEVLKILHLHPNTTSFLILNKTDTLKKRSILLETTRKLTDGVVAGHEMTFPDRVKGRKTETMINMNDKYFSKLEHRYGSVKHKKKTSSSMFWQAYRQKMAGIDDAGAHEESVESGENIEQYASDQNNSEKHIGGKNNVTEMDCQNHFNTSNNANVEKQFKKDSHADKPVVTVHVKSDLVQRAENSVAETDCHNHLETSNNANAKMESAGDNLKEGAVPGEANHDESEEETQELNDSIAELEKTYQSDFLARLRATAAPAVDRQDKRQKNKRKSEEAELSWTDRMERIKAAGQATSWRGFHRVFMVSALDGEGVGDIKNYVFGLARPGDWEFNSCLVTPQHPHDIAKMLVWQCLLDNVPDWLPYSATPEIVYWGIDQYDRLDIVVEVVVDCQLTRFIGIEGGTVRKISDEARQALLDAFQCEVSFKLMLRQRSRREAKQA